MIELNNLQFAYAAGGFQLRLEHLSIPSGQRLGWTGPSGSGKTTLLHLIAGILPPATGSIHTCGVELTTLREAARRDFRIANIGLIFQDFALLDYLSVLDNILLPYRINRSLRLDGSVRDRAGQLAENVGLGQLLSRRPAQLSQGERQRVAVCRALLPTPQLLLADEPTANLDPRNAARVLQALGEYAQQHAATMIVVTHDPNLLSDFDDTIDMATFCDPAPPELGEGGIHA